MVSKVTIWNKVVGYVAWDDSRGVAMFEFNPSFERHGLDISPITMPIDEIRSGNRIYSFPTIEKNTFLGLPGLLSDSLPDRFGNKMLDAWLARKGRSLSSITPIERLCYTGKRALGALEFEPVLSPEKDSTGELEIESIVNLVNDILAERSNFNSNIHSDSSNSIMNIIRLGTSAGGARPKAVITYNEKTGEIRSGHVPVKKNFYHWIIKLDGVDNGELVSGREYGRIEYAYYLMAKDCGITMNPCKLLEENGRAHFMTRRFDRPQGNEKLHLQSLCAVAHFDYNNPDAYSYEQAFQVMRKMRLSYPEAQQLFTRLVFNVIANNNDDHTKNISFLMDQNGNWALSPAYDVTFAYDPENFWLKRHQMSVNGKRSEIVGPDILNLAREMNIKNASEIIDKVLESISKWQEFAKDAGVDKKVIEAINKSFNLMQYN